LESSRIEDWKIRLISLTRSPPEFVITMDCALLSMSLRIVNLGVTPLEFE